jgi:hypothetical protein
MRVGEGWEIFAQVVRPTTPKSGTTDIFIVRRSPRKVFPNVNLGRIFLG